MFWSRKRKKATHHNHSFPPGHPFQGLSQKCQEEFFKSGLTEDEVIEDFDDFLKIIFFTSKSSREERMDMKLQLTHVEERYQDFKAKKNENDKDAKKKHGIFSSVVSSLFPHHPEDASNKKKKLAITPPPARKMGRNNSLPKDHDNTHQLKKRSSSFNEKNRNDLSRNLGAKRASLGEGRVEKVPDIIENVPGSEEGKGVIVTKKGGTASKRGTLEDKKSPTSPRKEEESGASNKSPGSSRKASGEGGRSRRRGESSPKDRAKTHNSSEKELSTSKSKHSTPKKRHSLSNRSSEKPKEEKSSPSASVPRVESSQQVDPVEPAQPVAPERGHSEHGHHDSEHGHHDSERGHHEPVDPKEHHEHAEPVDPKENEDEAKTPFVESELAAGEEALDEIVLVPVHQHTNEEVEKKGDVLLKKPPLFRDATRPMFTSLELEDLFSHPLHYTFRKIQVIGKGAFAKVYLARIHDRPDKGFFAIKITENVSKNPKTVHHLANEILLMEKCRNHDNIVKYFATHRYSVRDEIWMVMEYCTCSLQDLLVGDLGEKYIRLFTFQLLNALSFLAQNSIVHRDFKSANVLVKVDESSNDIMVKLADFGLAVVVNGPRSGKSVCGSRFWMAPEMLKNEGYGCKADLWALGCVMFEMMDTSPPYYEHNSIKAMFYTVTKGAASIRQPHRWTTQMHDFLGAIFQVDPDARPSADELLKHPWVNNKELHNMDHSQMKDILRSASFMKIFDTSVYV
eukprot:TRINITY_DN2215_c0_g1_i2.p1 TRINITY_DN2215_c0_g1~~TRINITY_DN2215_c0_g1_i2.p1  ORF type:complete len:738 (+),score=202.56 TRINITY_DN2215_c0_g1_i2:59-2272(+)